MCILTSYFSSYLPTSAAKQLLQLLMPVNMGSQNIVRSDFWGNTHTHDLDHELLLIGLTLLFIIHRVTARQGSINLSPRNNYRFDIARKACCAMPMD